MRRHNAGSCTGAVNNTAIGGPSVRDTARADTSSLPNFSLNSRRSSVLTPYKLKCDKESINSRLGPPDFYPQTANCPEETLTREYVQSGYKETVEGIQEAGEISLTQLQSLHKPVVLKCKEAIRKRFRAINESRAQKRKAGQVYGVPLSETLLAKHGVFPEQRPYGGEDYRKKWIEGLSQSHKRLRSLADHVPHGYRKKFLIEVLIKNNVPLLRATWFIKVTYLNQVRPGSASNNISSGAPDKTRYSRTELWTKDVVDYLQCLVDEYFSKNNSHSTGHNRTSQVIYTGSSFNKNDLTPAGTDGGEPSLHVKWWYMVRMLQWHHAEGLLLPSYIIDWVLNQLQDKELLEILQLLLPIIHGIIETLVLSQTYVRTLVGVAVRFIREPSPGGSDLVDNSRRAYTTSAIIELLRFLILAVPDTFVALNCFPLPSCVISNALNDGGFFSKVSEDAGRVRNGAVEVSSLFRERGLDAKYQSLSFNHVVSSIQKCANDLAKAASPGYPGRNVAKAVQALDKALVLGDVTGAYKFLFDNLGDGAMDESWIADVNTSLRSSMKWIGIVGSSFIYSVFFLCEWATCDFRDFRTAPPQDLKFTGGKDYSQIYIAIRLLKLKMKELQIPLQYKNGSGFGVDFIAKGQANSSMGTVNGIKNKLKSGDGKKIKLSDILQSPGPLHDVIVCWIDQHEVHKGEGFKRLQLLVLELTRSGIFYPQAYVRQLIISGIMDCTGPLVKLDRRKKHHRVLKQMPASYVRDALEEARIAEVPLLIEAMHVYANERRLVLRGFLCDQNRSKNSTTTSHHKQKHLTSGRDGPSPTSADQWKSFPSTNVSSLKILKNASVIEELKSSISLVLQLPSSSLSTDSGLDESLGSVKRSIGPAGNKIEILEGTPGCEECKKVNRQKTSEERSPCLQGHSPNLSDDEDTWWLRKGTKSFESFKADPPLKQTKQAPRGRQKNVRKTNSLAQLAAARIESSQGASTSHVCDNRISCPQHKSVTDGEALKSIDRIQTASCGDIVSIGKVLKQLRFVEKRAISGWLTSAVRQLVEETEKSAAKAGQFNRSFSTAEERCPVQWKLGEEELSSILYLLDVSNDVVSAVRLLLWLLPKVLSSSNSTIHGGRNMPILGRTLESHVCEVREAFLLSSIRRYENVLAATDLIPETLLATMQRAAAVMASSNGRVSSSSAATYAKYLLKRYNSVPSVAEWEKNFKATCDQRFLSELESVVPSGVEDDDYFRQKMSGARLSRVGLSMRDIVQRNVEDAFHYFFGKDRKHFVVGGQKSTAMEKWDDGQQIAKQIVSGLIECLRQTGGAAQEGDPSLVSSGVSAIVSNVGPALAKIPDFTLSSNYSNSQSSATSLNIARLILRIHLSCLCLLKEAFGERHSSVFEIALVTEASSALAGAFAPVKAPRVQFQQSPEAHDSNANMSNEVLTNSAKVVVTRPTKIAAAVSALVIEAVVHGIMSLERMVTVFRLKEGLDVIHFLRSSRSSSNGNVRSAGALSPVEVYVHWFRLLVGNCRSVSDGLIVELLGEASMVAFSRMQRMLPLSLVFPPAYSIFALFIWKPFLINNTCIASNEDLHQSLMAAIGDTIKHQPFRDVCMRDTDSLYDLVAADSTDSEFAAMLEHSGPEMQKIVSAFIPLRARLFLNSIIDCKMPTSIFAQDDVSRVSGLGEPKVLFPQNEANLLDKLVNVLDTLQPAKFHWQWVELRLLLNEQALIEKLDTHDLSLVDALRSLSPNPEQASASESESNFVEIILTRLLVRPDSAPLLSEVVHHFGRLLEESMLLQVKWFLGGHDVLLGRKSIRQRLINIAETKKLSTSTQFWKPWGWSYCSLDVSTDKGEKRKFEAISLEEGEVVEEGLELKKHGKGSTQMFDTEGAYFSKQLLTERALVELVLPCIDQSSDESRHTFASDLIKQMSNIEQQLNGVIRGAGKPAGTNSSGIESPVNKGSNRRAIRGGSPGLTKRATGAADSVPASPAALRASMSLRLQFLLRLLPIICGDREPSGRNMRPMLASVILRLLGSRVVHEDLDPSFHAMPRVLSQREVEFPVGASAAAAGDVSRENLFDRLLWVLHGLLSNCLPSWLKLKSTPKLGNEPVKNFSVFDRDVAESLQNDLDRMYLPDVVRWRIQTAMPVLVPLGRCSISCQPPSVPSSSLAALQPSLSAPGSQTGNSNPLYKSSFPSGRAATNIPTKAKTLSSQQDHDMEIDPWTLLEDGAISGSSSSNGAAIGSDHANPKASSWLRGAIRVRRTDLTYVGAVDDDS